jgi:hypothetical protein
MLLGRGRGALPGALQGSRYAIMKVAVALQQSARFAHPRCDSITPLGER